MAFSAGIGDRGPIKSPREEPSFASITSPLRGGPVGSQMSSQMASQISSASSDARGQLHRRFTTNNIPTLSTPLSPIGQQRRQAAEPPEVTTAMYHKLQVLEIRKLEYEYLKERRRRFDAELELFDYQSRRDEAEAPRLSSSDIQYGKHSQPTTPPEYSDSFGFPTALSRPNRFSMSSVTGVSTPRGSGSRPVSQIMSPPSNQVTQGNHGTANGQLPSHSVPGSRRNSDEEGEDFDKTEYTPKSPVFRSHNRMSMPVTGLDFQARDDIPDLASVLGHINTTAFLFGDEEKQKNPAASPEAKSFLQMNTTDDRFPILVRRDTNGNGGDVQSNGWSAYRHRQSQQSLPTNTLRKPSQAEEYENGQVNGNVPDTTPTKPLSNNRRSVEFGGLNSYSTPSKRASYQASPSSVSNGTNGMPKLQQSYSASEVPTLKNGDGINGVNGSGGFNTHAEQHLHNHNASLGRIPNNAATNRTSRDFSTASLQSNLHASAAPFGPPVVTNASINGSNSSSGTNMSQYSTQTPPSAPYYGYGMAMLNGAMNGLALGPQYGAPPVYNPNGTHPTTQFFNPYTTYGPNGRVLDSQARVIQSRRLQSDANRFLNIDLKTLPRSEIYTLCKDQHGCRFLQKKLEERDTEHLDIIFNETSPHVVELMTDPFGNYLCQKLLEFTNDKQRDALVRYAGSSLVQIALNQHGTRALQKMIEFISTPQQIRIIIDAFKNNVVDLIQDLNGNHVIQKCLNHLKSEDAQFIFDAVGQHCVIVGTHRHGCCVLQRCIDHASGFQKVQLVRQITANSYNLVQDPFGNYVVQYILDLNEPSFTNPLCIGFAEKVAELSKQKFSSNVIEKCIRCADMPTKRIIIEELMDREELEKLMRDSYGNYVIQTALEFAPADLCMHLIDAMRPILPGIRQTPYGRRIQTKVQERESRLQGFAGRSSGHVSPHTVATTQSPETQSAFTGQLPVSSGFQAPPMYTAAANTYGSNIASPQPHRMSNPPLPHHLQNSVQNQVYPQYGHVQANSMNGMNGFF